MNRTYNPNERYSVSYGEGINAPAPIVKAGKKVVGVAEALLLIFDLVFGFFAEPAVRIGLRVLAAVASFFTFLFVVGAVEAGTLSFGAGVLATLLLFAIAFVSVYRHGAKRD